MVVQSRYCSVWEKNHIEITSVTGSSDKLDGTKRDTPNAQGGTASRSAIKQNEPNIK